MAVVPGKHYTTRYGSDRWHEGEAGLALENDFPKYDAKIDFGDVEIEGKMFNRIFYFYEYELEPPPNCDWCQDTKRIYGESDRPGGDTCPMC